MYSDDPLPLSIVIPTHNKGPRLRLCLESLLGAVREWELPCEVIVVDDGSQSDTSFLLSTMQVCTPDVSLRVIRRAVAGGRSVARNEGAWAANGSLLLFLDDDVLVDTAVLASHYAAHQNRTTPALARATILNLPWLRAVADPTRQDGELPPKLAERLIPDSRDTSSIEFIRPHARRSRFEADLHRLLETLPESENGRWLAATGGNLSLTRDFFRQLGGFDENLGLRWGVEDLEFGFRAEKAGAILLHLNDVAVYHLDHEVINRESDHQSALAYFQEKHGFAQGKALTAYFAGQLDILEVAGK